MNSLRFYINIIIGVVLLLSLAGCASPPVFVEFPGFARVGTPIPISPRIVGQWRRTVQPKNPGPGVAPVVETISIYPFSSKYYFICDKATGGPLKSNNGTTNSGDFYAKAFLVHSGRSFVLDVNVLDPIGFVSLNGQFPDGKFPASINRFLAWRFNRTRYYCPRFSLYKITVGQNWLSVLPFDIKNPKGFPRKKSKLMQVLQWLGLTSSSSPQQVQAALRKLAKKVYEENPNGFGLHHAPMVFHRVLSPK